VVPVILLLRVIPVDCPEQIVSDAGVAVTDGDGFTVIVTVIGAPVHPLAVGVIVYTAVPEVIPVVANV
jgi:hypothetical protein